MGIVLAIVVFSVIVLVHELGHFLLAKKNGIRVDEFSIGMGPNLFAKQIGETKYCIKLLPLGGSCMMGEDDDDMSEGSFNSKSVWARISVIAAGPVFNFLLAFIFAVIIVACVGYDKPVLSDVSDGYAAQEAGIMPGDTIVKLNNKKINVWREVVYYNLFNGDGESVKVTYLRDGERHTTTVTPTKDETGAYKLGVVGPTTYEKANVLTAVQYGVYEVKFWIWSTIESLKMLVTGQVGVNEMSGPVGIVSMVGDTYNEARSYGFFVVMVQMLNIGILLSANLGVMNLLPIPALDGGRLVFLIIEAIRRKRIPPEKEGFVHMIGFVLLMLLMVFVMFNDIKKLF